jgi:hypothetical protein
MGTGTGTASTLHTHSFSLPFYERKVFGPCMLYFKEYIVQFWLVPFREKFIVVTFELFCSVGSRYQMIVGLELWGRLSNTTWMETLLQISNRKLPQNATRNVPPEKYVLTYCRSISFTGNSNQIS